MCEPFTLAVATGVAVAGTLTSAYGQYRGMQFQQAVAQREATMSRMAAGDALARGQAAATRVATRGSQVVGAQKAAAAASGVDVASGSSAGNIAATQAGVALDVRTTQNNAAREAWGLEAEATSQDLRAQQYGSAAGYAFVGGGLSAAGSALGGGAKAYKAYKEAGDNWWGP